MIKLSISNNALHSVFLTGRWRQVILIQSLAGLLCSGFEVGRSMIPNSGLKVRSVSSSISPTARHDNKRRNSQNSHGREGNLFMGFHSTQGILDELPTEASQGKSAVGIRESQQNRTRKYLSDLKQPRREMLRSAVLATTSFLVVSLAEGETATSIASALDVAEVNTAVEMKDFVDPKGLFQLTVPKRFYTLRRTVKGDLPDEKTGKDGRRGSSIFTAGDMAKAEVIAVERYPAKLLLEEEGFLVSDNDALDSISKLGKPEAVAQLIMRRRERDRPGQMTRTVIIPDSVQVTDSGKTLQFQTKSDIDVQKPELLMEQMGVDKLTRISTAKATLTPSTENPSIEMFMIVFASALEQDFRGPDGQALQSSVDSFTVTSSAMVI